MQRLEESISQNKEILELTNDQDSSKDTPTDNKSNQSAPIREILDNGPETESVKNIDSDKADIETKSQPKKTTAKKTTAKKTTAKKTTAKKTTTKKSDSSKKDSE